MPNDTENTSIVIDCHCHTFNAKDLPIYGFLKKVALNADERILPKLVLPLAKMLEKLTRNAKSAEKELAKLEELLSPDGLLGVGAMAETVNEDREEDEAFVEDLRRVLYDLENSDDEKDNELFYLLEDEIFPEGDGVLASSSSLDVTKAIWQSRGVVSRYIKWVKVLLKYRYKITERLIRTYSSSGEQVHLFTPAVIDYDFWVNDEAKTSLPRQIELMEGNIRLNDGKVHPFFPFDPWRESLDPDGDRGSLHWLKKAIANHGFVGAKLYPPMGYRPIDNSSLTDFPENASKPLQEFGTELDNAMISLYDYCTENEIPILTHCANSNETEKEFGKRAAPEHWVKVIDKYPRLRVNLGHFGGLKTLRKDGGWAWQVGELLNDPNKNVYADVSHYGAILNKGKRRETMDNLQRLFDTYPHAVNRIIFGTDWIMLARIRKHEDFLKVFRRAYLEQFGQENCDKFMGLNAAHFLGIQTGGNTRSRLEGFYEKHNIEKPEWFNLC